MSISSSPRGVYATWTKWARPQAEWAQGPTGLPNSFIGQLGFEAGRPEPWFPCVYTRRRRLSRWRKLVEAAPPGLHLVPNPPIQVGGGPIHPYKYPPCSESQHTTLNLYFSTCKGSSLVVVAQVRPCQESSRVESLLDLRK
jgi:hypothetical protein